MCALFSLGNTLHCTWHNGRLWCQIFGNSKSGKPSKSDSLPPANDGPVCMAWKRVLQREEGTPTRMYPPQLRIFRKIWFLAIYPNRLAPSHLRALMGFGFIYIPVNAKSKLIHSGSTSILTWALNYRNVSPSVAPSRQVQVPLLDPSWSTATSAFDRQASSRHGKPL